MTRRHALGSSGNRVRRSRRRRRLRRLRQRRRLRRHRRRRRSSGSGAASCPSTSRGSRGWCGATSRSSGSRSPPTSPRRCAAPRWCFIAVGTPSAHDGSADLSQVLAAAEPIGRAIDRLHRRGHQVDRARRHRATRSRPPSRTVTKQPFAVASQPRVPQGGRRGQRLHEARPRHHRHRRRARARRAAPPLRAVRAHQRSHPVHGRALGRADQVRLQRLSGDAHLAS